MLLLFFLFFFCFCRYFKYSIIIKFLSKTLFTHSSLLTQPTPPNHLPSQPFQPNSKNSSNSTTPTYPSKPIFNSTPPTTLLQTHHFIPPSHPFNLLLSNPSLFQLLLHHFYSSFILPSPPPPFISITIPPSLSPNPSQISPLPLHPMNPLNSTHQTLPPTHPPHRGTQGTLTKGVGWWCG